MILLVHETKPAFLTGKKKLLSKQKGPVMPLKDPTSDMAIIARQGSGLVREMRDKKEKNKFRQRFWEVAGSKMGKITGLTKTEVEEAEKAKQQEMLEMGISEDAAADDDYKASSQFMKHLKSDVTGDEAARQKIIKQRRSLPVYSVREELMQVARSDTFSLKSLYISHSIDHQRKPSGGGHWRDWLWQDNANDSVFDRGWLQRSWHDWMHSASKSGCHERRQARQ